MSKTKPKVVLLFDYDLTLTEEYQQMPIIRDNFERVKEAHNGKIVRMRVLHPKSKHVSFIKSLESRLRGGFGKIKGKVIDISKYNGSMDIVTLDLGPIEIKTPEDYFETADVCSVPHNGFGYVQQFIRDAQSGVFGSLTIERLCGYGKQVKVSDGAVGFIPALKKKWKGRCELEAHIISVGIQEVIMGHPLAMEFDSVRATSLVEIKEIDACDNSSVPVQKIAVNHALDVVTPFNKSKHVIEIAKGGVEHLNRRMKKDDYSVDYRRMKTFGDGLSDVSQFAYLGKKGSDIICVYTYNNEESFRRAFNNQTLRERVRYLLPRFYGRDGPTWDVINERIERTLSRKCDMNPALLDIYRKNKTGDDTVDEAIRKHIAKCPECKTATSFNWVDTMRES